MAPPITSGQPKPESVSSQPAIEGLMAEARLRGTEVTLAAAVRSAGVTTDSTYDVRVGTSICESALRTRSSATATQRLGAKGISIRQRFDGRCVNTMVLMRPKRFEMRAAAGYEN